MLRVAEKSHQGLVEDGKASQTTVAGNSLSCYAIQIAYSFALPAALAAQIANLYESMIRGQVERGRVFAQVCGGKNERYV